MPLQPDKLPTLKLHLGKRSFSRVDFLELWKSISVLDVSKLAINIPGSHCVLHKHKDNTCQDDSDSDEVYHQGCSQ